MREGKDCGTCLRIFCTPKQKTENAGVGAESLKYLVLEKQVCS